MLPATSPPCRPRSDTDPTVAPFGLGSTLTEKCHFYLTYGLAPSMRKVYSSAQHRFQVFCIQDNCLSPSSSVLPASEETLIWFCQFTVNSLFYPDIHLTVDDIQADSLFNTRSFRIYIKCSKMDPFRSGCYIYNSTRSSTFAQFMTWLNIYICIALLLGPCFYSQMAHL